MTTPRVTELPLRMEPTTPDPFLCDPGRAVPVIREVDAFEIPVAQHDARDAFDHPHAHAAFRGIDYRRDPRLAESD